MKLKRIMILLICGLPLLLNGCAKDQVIVKPPQKIECPAPERPVLVPTKVYDPKIFFGNFSMITEYSLILEQTVKCYKDALK